MPSKRIIKGMNPYKKMFSFVDNEVPRSYEGLDTSLNYLEQLILFKGRRMKAKQTWTDRTFLFVRKSSMPDDDTFVRKEDFALVAWIPNVFDVILNVKKINRYFNYRTLLLSFVLLFENISILGPEIMFGNVCAREALYIYELAFMRKIALCYVSVLPNLIIK